MQLTPTLSASEQWRLVETIAASSLFRRSPKLRSFLLYIGENSLMGRREAIREQLIGHRVFGRPPDYNVAEDNIVRVEARELRKRLTAYFEGEGKDAPFRIEVPKGGYLVQFVPRGVEAPAEEEAASPADTEEENESIDPAPVAAAPSAAYPRVVWVLAAAVAVLLATAGILFRQNRILEAHVRRDFERLGAEDRARYAELLGPIGAANRGEALLVLSNPRVLMYFGSNSADPAFGKWDKSEPLIRVPSSLEALLAGALQPGRKPYSNHYLKLATKTYTGIGEAVSAYHLGRLLPLLDRRIRLSQGRFLSWDRVQKQDLIVAGSPHLNPWTSENAPEMNFVFGPGGFRNNKPQPGELAEYLSTEEVDYGIISMFVWPSGSRALFLAGYRSPGTAAAGEFFATPEKMRAVYEKIKAESGGRPSAWEVLLRIRVKDSIPLGAEMIASRVRPLAP